MKSIHIKPQAEEILNEVRQDNVDIHGNPASYSFAIIELKRLSGEHNE